MYLLLRSPKDSPDDTLRWESVGFYRSAEMAISSLMRRKRNVQRGDLFAVIASEYVSEITTDNMNWFGIAVKDGVVVPVPNMPKAGNWLNAYDVYGDKAMFNVIRPALSLRGLYSFFSRGLKSPRKDLFFLVTQSTQWIKLEDG